MTSAGGWGGYSQDGDGGVGREPGTRRRKLAGYLKAANELRQTYQQNYVQPWAGSRDGAGDTNSMPGTFPDGTMATARAGEQEMVIFPSYAKRHIRQKPTAIPGTIQETPGTGRDVRDTGGSGDAEFWKEQWDNYEDDSAIVDVDVRGWIYTPHKGPLSRRNRLFVGLARQMVGIPAPAPSPNASQPSSRTTSPYGLRQRVDASSTRREEEIVAKEAESLIRKGEAEADAAGKGAYSEEPGDDLADVAMSRSREGSPAAFDDSRIRPVQKRSSWTTPARMSPAELATANGHLMTRLRPFLANPIASVPISAFFYNKDQSRQKTIDTDSSGHFTLRAALDFVPTHVRVLAVEGLSVTEEIIITEPKGISVISDIDDTIKHSAIADGAREIFRNVFIRELGDLSIDGVKEWYQKLASMGVDFHYVSNSPWQLYPVLTGFFSMAGLPKGSFHLKQYSGMFQGIFEPVAERKKGTLEKIMRDFPNRRFILIGDSGEADLEVYTDVVCENPGRILGVFIRDVTTPASSKAFFDSYEATGGQRGRPGQRSNNVGLRDPRKGLQTTRSEDDVDTKAGIADSLGALNFSDKGRDEERPGLPPRPKTDGPSIEENLIDLDSEPEDVTEQSKSTHLSPPTRPPKPRRLSSATVSATINDSTAQKTAPLVPPKKPSISAASPIGPSSTDPSTKQQADALKGDTAPIRKRPPPPPPPRATYREAAKQRLGAAYDRLPSPASYLRSSSQPPAADARNLGFSDGRKPPPLPTRKPTFSSTQSYAATAVNYASSLYTSATASTSTDTLPLPTIGPPHGANSAATSTAASNATSYAANSQPVNKKVELWRRRWARAQAILEDDGVVLRTWRGGGDVENVVLELVERAMKEDDSIAQGARRGNRK